MHPWCSRHSLPLVGLRAGRRQNRSSGAILGEKAMRATLEWPGASWWRGRPQPPALSLPRVGRAARLAFATSESLSSAGVGGLAAVRPVRWGRTAPHPASLVAAATSSATLPTRGREIRGRIAHPVLGKSPLTSPELPPRIPLIPLTKKHTSRDFGQTYPRRFQRAYYPLSWVARTEFATKDDGPACGRVGASSTWAP